MKTRLKLKFSYFLKEYYFFIFTPFYCGVMWFFYPYSQKLMGVIATATGVYLSIMYFFQKQNLEELKAFKELFVEFNARYDKLNNKLNKIDSEDDKNNILDDYFNLCAEEYLFYKKGVIVKEVWCSWCKGMQSHLKHQTILDYWNKAQHEESYYGLTTKAINSGAKG